MSKLNGYKTLYMPNYHKTIDGSMVYEHIYIAESRILHRYLEDDECVHHIDGNRSNNNIDNLMVFKTKADHVRYHNMMNKPEYYELKKNSDNTYYCNKIKDLHVCKICGKSIDNHATLCLSCYKKENSKHIPNRDILKKYIRDKSFEEIGRLFSVSGKAISKWCKKLLLPYRKKDIVLYSDEEWVYV